MSFLSNPLQYQAPDKNVTGEDTQVTVDKVGSKKSVCRLPSTGRHGCVRSDGTRKFEKAKGSAPSQKR